EPIIIGLGWVGIYAPLALGAMGSMIGCSKAGMAAAGALLEVEGGYGRYIGLSAMPSSQTIYGIVVMLSFRVPLTMDNAPGIFALGFLCGLALLTSASAQGDALAASIAAAKSKPEIYGISIAPAAIIEGFAVFAFVFALVLGGGLTS
ncbi:MAG: ATP synthase subunit C, partial [Myxococcota bacterium]